MVADRMDEFELGTSMISIRSGAPVVPIYMMNDSIRKMRIRMIVGEPLRSEDSAMNVSRRENEQLFTARIRNSMNALKKELESICG